MSVFAIIPAGGTGKRCSESFPKQFHLINGKEIIAYSLEVFQNSSLIDEIIVAVQPDYLGLMKSIIDRFRLTKVKKVVNGGAERQDSVFNALIELNAVKDDLIAVHDAARPLLTKEILEKAVKEAEKFDNVVVCCKAKDTLLKGDEFVVSYIERKDVYYVQTPQIFKYDVLRKSMEFAYANNFYGTDESMLLRNAGYNVKIVEGSAINFKITTKDDIKLFASLVEGKIISE
jgi:2-C-methyl-D-erythritol 4-phosphate cytidylyltransferase